MNVPVMSKEIQTRGLYNAVVTYVGIKMGLSKADNIKVFGQVLTVILIVIVILILIAFGFC